MTLTPIFAKVLNMSLTASLVIVLVIAARFILRKSPKVFSYALWAVVLFRLLCPVSLPSPVSLLGLLDAPVAQTEGITTTVEYIPYRVVETAAENLQPIQLPQNTVVQAPTQSQQATVEPQREPLSTAEIITYIWLAGIVVMVIVGVGSYLRFRKHLTGAMQVKDNIYLVDHIDSAFVAGLIRPKVYLPSDIPLKQMGYIIAHEQYHIRRLDHVTKHLSFAALCIHWFNPFVWVAFILSGKDLEMSCDEAVIKRLGEGIRADYSASLLSLATGRRIIAGTPLAFGEGDTKGRINNMAKWKQPKKWVSIVSFILCFTILTACAANPEQEVVISKNDGSFDVKVVQSATSPTASNGGEGTTQNVKCNETFFSTDGSVEFTLDIDTHITNDAMPVIEVVPHYLTGEDAQRVAELLFPGEVFYEAEPTLTNQLTREELQEYIQLVTPYLDKEKIVEIDPNCAGREEDEIELLRSFIEGATNAMERVPEGWTHEVTSWKMYPDPHYMYSPEEIEEENLYASNDYNDQIKVTVKVGQIPYCLSFSTRNRDDFKINNIYVQSLSNFPGDLPDKIYSAMLCRTLEPTAEQVNAAAAKADELLNAMGLGEWIVVNAKAEPHYSGVGYWINVHAVPVFQGIPVVQVPQIGHLNNNENVYASNYYHTKANFTFNAYGELIDMELYSPVDIKQTVNSNVAVLPMDELMERAISHLSLSDSEQYGREQEWYEQEYGEKIVCNVTLSEMEYGLLRVKVPNTDDSYYYVPGILLFGGVEFRGETTSNMYDLGYTEPGLVLPMVALNAIDGTIVELSQD